MMKKKKLLVTLLTLLPALLLPVTGCYLNEDKGEVVSVTIMYQGLPVFNPINAFPGDMLQFFADVEVKNGASTAVAWAVTGGVNSFISSGGLLFVGSAETPGSLIVSAASVKDTSKSGFAVINVPGEDAPLVKNIIVTTAGNAETVKPGESLQFGADVQVENNAAQTVTWSVTSGRHADTNVSPEGLLSVSPDEAIGRELTVRAASTVQGFENKYGEKTVTVAAVTPQSFSITYNRPFPNGDITGPASSPQGATVNLTLLPNSGSTLQTITVTKQGGGNETVNGSGSTRTFTMPPDNVTVSAAFTAPDPGGDGLNIGDVVPGKGKLVWRDEFNGNSLDMTKWNYDYGAGGQYGKWGWGNGEKQWYKPQNVRVEGGYLVLEAGKGGPNTDYPYTSGKIVNAGTRGSTDQTPNVNNQTLPPPGGGFPGVKTGYVEARIRGPKGRGFWPAFWMLSANENQYFHPPNGRYSWYGWPQCGEIDILETIGGQEGRMHQTIHYGENPFNDQRKWSKGTTFNLSPDAGSAFHTYGVKWNSTGLQYYCDDVLRMNQNFPLPEGTAAHTESFYNDIPWVIIFNLAVGGNMGGGDPTDASLTNSNWEGRSLTVDWVRVYED